MPTYLYECEKCGQQFEEFAHMSDVDGIKPLCPECGSPKCFRDFKSERAGGFVGPTTLGMIAEKNTYKSEDELHHIKEKNYAYLKNRPKEERIDTRRKKRYRK